MTDLCCGCSTPSCRHHSSLFTKPRVNFISILHSDSLVLTAALRCRLVLALLFYKKETRYPLGSHDGYPAAGLTTFPRKSGLSVVTSQRSRRKGRLKRACGADVAFSERGWERRPEATPASVPRSLTSTVALCDT